MKNRELLELAAKAAELQVEPCANGWGERWPLGWNPLTDDGDALRLTVKLKIDTKHYNDYVVCWYHDFFGTGKISYDDDPYAATRRAIVRAAAEIGKAMP